MTTVEAIPIREISTTVGWVPIEDFPGPKTLFTSEDASTTTTTTVATTTVTRSASYATTSFKDAQIQYVPYRLEEKTLGGTIF